MNKIDTTVVTEVQAAPSGVANRARGSLGRLALGVGALVVGAGCSSSGSSSGQESPSSAAYVPVPAKQWTVDTSGWWVPDDPTGCLNETVNCPMSAWPVREYYKGGIAVDVFKHGDTLTLYCKAPTPVAIRNSLQTESVYWYYAEQGGNTWWVPDIYVTKDDVQGMAAGVPDCPSNTPGINGRESTEPASPTATPS